MIKFKSKYNLQGFTIQSQPYFNKFTVTLCCINPTMAPKNIYLKYFTTQQHSINE